ncbi:NnrU family protein, required for expression of nitric oxide and nitrite reductase (Nir and Nor) [Rubellimicrobium mesophilum DSM 19309]|uniref:NnrU family protein, required for expression of nitric oxide and nitrite reductase (Nir and Nor) n=1 Tax=Rubellimicrobium mesophilum DSM 19309 TaxID=442562 RepID=A0A017HQQ8_9RHOB|nr:NnrU family protein [Rubellimicrobium mesophilum]EYD76721.1 NnrU family protein, required for expression of nitric oxide and nitrite reductase (Nir and Nor) [Rubellimicrobium mesophilum DSM 19309]
MTGWAGYALAWTAFVGTHFVPTRPAIRARLIEALGRRAWFSIYGVISLLVTAWVIAAAAWPPYVELWPQLPWTRWVPNLVMPLAIAVTTLGLPARTTTLSGPRAPKLDPTAPGFAALTRHPLLLALALWSLSHLFPNGDLAHVILFGGFALMALAAMPAFDARARAALSPEAARAYFATTSALSLRPLASAAWWRVAVAARAGRLLLAVAIWLAVLWLHPYVIGVSPLPV